MVITINSIAIPAQSDFQKDYEPILGESTKRNANALLVAELVAQKTKLSLSWKYLTRTQVALIESCFPAPPDIFVPVTYYDEITESIISGTFYPSPRSYPFYTYISGVATFRNCKFNLIER